MFRRIVVYIFRLLSIGLSLSDEANKMRFLNKQKSITISVISENLIPNSFGEILFEKPQNLQRMYELICLAHLNIFI